MCLCGLVMMTYFEFDASWQMTNTRKRLCCLWLKTSLYIGVYHQWGCFVESVVCIRNAGELRQFTVSESTFIHTYLSVLRSFGLGHGQVSLECPIDFTLRRKRWLWNGEAELVLGYCCNLRVVTVHALCTSRY